MGDCVYVHRSLNHRISELESRFATHDSRIIDQHGHCAESRLRTRSTFRDRRALGDINVHHVDVGRWDAKLDADLFRFFDALQVDVREGELRAHLSETLRHESTETIAGAREENVLLAQVLLPQSQAILPEELVEQAKENPRTDP